jgi:prepilin-type N-terminal cleavage/methylation domain-containing protein
MKSKRRGYTLIELMIVVSIISILASIVYPRMILVVEHAHQAKARNQLGLLRSTMTLYFSENEGQVPFSYYPEGTSEFLGASLTTVLVPRYINKIPTPQLYDGISFNGLSVPFDKQAKIQMDYSPPREFVVINGPPGYHPFTIHPYVYDSMSGNIYYNNGNRATTGELFFDW